MKDILAKLAAIENKKLLNEAKELSELKAGDKYGDDATAIGNGEMNAAISEDDEEICSSCNGSGEGQYDGTTCSSCGGSGTNRSNSEEHDEDEREWQRKSKEDRELDEGAKYKPETPYGVQYKVFAGKEQRLTTKEAWFKSAEAMKRGIAKIENLDGFYEIVGHHYPEDMMKEAAEEVTEFNDFDAPDDRQKADNGAFSTTGAPCPESKIAEATHVSTFKQVAKEVNAHAKSVGYTLFSKTSTSYTWSKKLDNGVAYFEIMWGDTDYMYWAEGELKKNGKKESWNSGTDQPEDIMIHAQEYMQNDDEEPEYQHEEPEDENDGELDEHIVKTGSQYELKSHKGKNLGKFKSHKAAAKHEGEVEWFKSHPKESVDKMKTNEDTAKDEPQAWKVLKGTDDKIYQIYVMHNYYNGKYYDYGGRAYPILASSPEEALRIARKYKGEIEADLRSKFFKVGSRRVRMISKNDNHHLKDSSFHTPKYPNMWTSGGARHVINRDGEFVSWPPKEEEVAESKLRSTKKAGTLKNESENDDLAGDDFINDETYDRLKKYLAAKHPGYKVHGLGPNENGGINWEAYHVNDKNFTKPIEGVFSAKEPVKEVAPKGWEGTVKKMKKHKEIENPWALANYMKDKGYKSHQKESKVNEISKKTLGNYIDKAVDSLDSAAWERGNESNPEGSWRAEKEASRVSDKRLKGIKTAAKKLVKESKENTMKKRKIIKESLTFLEHITDPALEKVLRHFGKEVKDFIHGGELDDSLYNALYDYYFDEMPYGTKKARTGDPFEWITNRLDKDLKGISVGHPADAADYAGMNEPSFAKTRPIGFPGDEADYDMDEGAAGDIGGDSGSGNDISPLSQVDEEEIDLDDLDDDEDLDEALTPAQQAKMAELRAKNANSPMTIGRNAIPPKASPYNPFADEKNDRSGDLAFNQQDSFQGYGAQREGLGEEELDETFLVEDNEGLIAEILEEHGLDHGLDFFFDNGLVAIGKSTARVIINALKADPRITATPSFGRIDGEEVQIAFNKEAGQSISNAEIKDLAAEPEQDFAESIVKEEVSISVSANGEEDVLNVMRRLSGLPEVESDISSPDEADDSEEVEIIEPENNEADSDEEEMGEAEGEYVNAPDPTVHTSTTDMINRGNDLNRPKRQDFTIRNLGNNPMAETRNLFKQYEAIKDTVKK